VLRKIFYLVSTLLIILSFLGILLLAAPRLVAAWHAAPRIFNAEQAPERRVAIVFGAGLRRDGSPSAVLRDRVATAADLYFSGKVEKLLMSGDNRFDDYNEPAAMQTYALRLGVPEEAIVLDYAGRRTYDTCYRARAIFGLQEVILVTQAFHLPRAIYTCNALGVDAVGVIADRREYRRLARAFWFTRETIATLTALVDVHLLHPVPVLGEPEPITFEVRE